MDNYYGNICYCRRCNGVVHTIKKGDTLYLISKYYKVPIGEIMNANRNINIYNLQIGDEICIPVRRPEPGEGNENIRPMPYINEGFMRNDSGMAENNEFAGDMSRRPILEMDEEDISSMSTEVESEDIDFDENSKVSDIISREDMTVEKFVKYMKKFDI